MSPCKPSFQKVSSLTITIRQRHQDCVQYQHTAVVDNHNTLNTESLEIEGFNTSFTEGLRVGTNAVARINFGGLVSAGVPEASAPDAGKWGFGRKGDERFANDYGKLTKVVDTEPATTTLVTFLLLRYSLIV